MGNLSASEPYAVCREHVADDGSGCCYARTHVLGSRLPCNHFVESLVVGAAPARQLPELQVVVGQALELLGGVGAVGRVARLDEAAMPNPVRTLCEHVAMRIGLLVEKGRSGPASVVYAPHSHPRLDWHAADFLAIAKHSPQESVHRRN